MDDFGDSGDPGNSSTDGMDERPAQRAVDATTRRLAGARSQAGRAANEAQRIITEHPVAAAAAAIAAGAVIALLFPGTSRRIRKAAPRVANALMEAAKTAQRALPDTGSLTQPAAEAAAALGRAAHQARDTLREAVVQSDLTGRASRVIGQAADSAIRATRAARARGGPADPKAADNSRGG